MIETQTCKSYHRRNFRIYNNSRIILFYSLGPQGRNGEEASGPPSARPFNKYLLPRYLRSPYVSNRDRARIPLPPRLESEAPKEWVNEVSTINVCVSCSRITYCLRGKMRVQESKLRHVPKYLFTACADLGTVFQIYPTQGTGIGQFYYSRMLSPYLRLMVQLLL